MLIAFYSTLIIFVCLFIFTFIYLVSLLKRKMATGGNILALVSLLLFTGSVSGVYGYDYLKLLAGEMQTAQGECLIKYDHNGKSIATTTVTIKDQAYQIKGNTYSSLSDGTYGCSIHYLPATKIIESLSIAEQE